MSVLEILRILHIIFGIYVVGSYIFLILILEPKLKRLGPPVQSQVMQAIMPTLLPVNGTSFVMLIVTGVALTLIVRSDALSSLLVTGWGWSMIVGLIATVTATIVGFGMIAPTGMRMEKISRTIVNRPPSSEEGRMLSQLASRAETLTRVMFALILVALAAMFAARYV
ncbi:MAG: hypothetical protein HYX92_21625 [Chloroflexi bacterium]|nr:hypothetical protein [Chloroflexota bacterium]